MQPRTKQRIKLGVVIGALLVLLIVFLQNTGQVTVKVLFTQMQMPMVAWLVLTLLAGFGLGYLTHSLMARRKGRDGQ